MRKLNIGIFGIGAVGQALGYVLHEAGHTINFFDRNGDPIKSIEKKPYFTIELVSIPDKGETVKRVTLDLKIFQSKREFDDFDVIFISVGYANISRVAEVLRNKLRGNRKTQLPRVAFLENYYEPEKLFSLTFPSYPKNKLIFGVPDIISYRTKKHFTRALDPFTFILGDMALVEEINDSRFAYATNVKTRFLQRLCTHNTAHNMLAYIGHAKKYKSIREAIADELIREKMMMALKEGAHGLVHEYGVSLEQQNMKITEEVDKLLVANFSDPISRVARTPIKKLHKYERFIFPALLAYKAGVFPNALCEGIAHLLAYYDPTDEESVTIAAKLKSGTVEEVLGYFSELDARHPITLKVKEIYAAL